jgi:hypothetical protein
MGFRDPEGDTMVDNEIDPVVTDDEPVAEEAGVKEPGEEKDPVPYERFKEVNDALKQFKALGLTTEVIAERLSRGQHLEKLAYSEPEPDKEPDSEEEASQKARAKKLILELFPKLENLDSMGQLMELHYEAMEVEAWSTVKEILDEEKMESATGDIKGMGSIIADVIKNDPRLRAKYNTGKVEDAVRGGWKKLSKKFGKTTAKPADDRPARIKDKEKLAGLPKKIAPGGRPESSVKKDDTGPKNLKEAGESAMKKLEGIFG